MTCNEIILWSLRADNEDGYTLSRYYSEERLQPIDEDTSDYDEAIAMAATTGQTNDYNKNDQPLQHITSQNIPINMTSQYTQLPSPPLSEGKRSTRSSRLSTTRPKLTTPVETIQVPFTATNMIQLTRQHITNFVSNIHMYIFV
ncbi:hypothetical protein BDF19DRAFT_270524 [Syncephalis fuscata]|nr:hypothetical protein BDF19DRAFT_270524 [Syncephalis fuscata]